MTEPAKKISTPQRQPVMAWLLLGATIVFIVFVRARLQSMPLERDEGEYAYAGQLMLQGIPPYELAYNMKLPGTYGAYAVIMALFGQTMEGIHLGLLVVNLGCILLVFLLGRKMFDVTVGAVAGATYGMVSLSPAVLGLAAHATNFVVLCMLAAMLCLLRAIQSGRWWIYFASGILFGLAFVMKQQGVLFGVFGGAWLVWLAWKAQPRNWNRFLPQITAYCAGCVLPFVLVCLWLWHAGVFANFWFWTFTYAGKYVTAVSFGEGMGLLRRELTRLAIPHWPFMLLALAGLVLLWWKRPARGVDLFLTLFLLFSAAAVCPGLYFREHYFLLLLPAFSICVGLAVRFGRRVAPLCFVIFALIFAAGRQFNLFFRQTPAEAVRGIYGTNPFFESTEIGRYIREHTTKDAQVIVFGSEPEIYFYAQRHSASGYIYMYDLMEDQPFALDMQKKLVAEAEAAKPEYFVVVKIASSWAQDPKSPAYMVNWGARYCRENYTLVGAFDLMPTYTDAVWGDAANDYEFHSQAQVLVFARKPSS